VDAVANTVAAANDYRVFQPALLTDPNGNRAAVSFDALGMVAGTAVMGKTSENLGDSLEGFVADLTQQQIDDFYGADDPHTLAGPLLGTATTRILYDVERFQRTQTAMPNDPSKWEPAFAATVARETHVSDLPPNQQSKLQISFSYSDGFGREIQKKIQAEPGPTSEGGPLVNPRWVSSGWTIFNNKGKPVRQYEPFFDDTHDFKFGNQVGVSPILFYDPVERVVATLHPNHTWEKVAFDPWRQESWDVNDTLLIADPKADQDLGDFFRRLPADDYLPSWYALRTDPSFAAEANQLWPDPKIRAAETDAATRAAAHANTPTIAFFDTLGRPFLTLAHNRFELNGAIVDEQYPTRVELDIEGNQRAVRDAIVQNGDASGRIVMRYDYDMLGNRIHQASMEAGERWMLNDVTGKPIRAWDSRGFMRRIAYDALRRATETFVTEKGVERLDTRTVYGEGQGAANNYRTRVFQVFDGAGVVTSAVYDFKGNLLRGRRELLPNYQQTVDWQQNPLPNDGTFTSSTTYDALNRPTAVTAPDNSIYRPTYNEANLLDTVEVNLSGASATTPFVTNINYDAKGQRELIAYGNGAQTHYEYDRLTFRLTRLQTTRPVGLNGLASQLFTGPAVVQDLRYTYDPVGNITRIEDAALPTIFHNNEQVHPISGYTYDAIYRLIEAQGREHIGQTAHDFNPPAGNRRDFDFAGLADFIAHPNDLQAMRNYTEGYAYDAVGNFQFMRHSANGGSWTRSYEYAAPSLIESARQSNRLTKTTVGNGTNFIETYTYTDAQGNDVHGCMTAINNMKMVWDSKDQLQQVDLGGGGTAYYVYDSGGQRVRKVIETQNGTRQRERIYLGGFEIYREYNGSGAIVTLERETLHIMDDKQRIALVETRTQGDDGSLKQLIRYQLGNHLGSASLELDDAGQIISFEEYYPYGSTSYQAGRSAAEVSLKRYRYTGMERDEESGLNYHSARFYALWIGRWISSDSIGADGGINLYAFVAGAPITRVDPKGTNDDEAIATAGQLQQHATELDVRRLPGETDSAYGTRMHKDFQNITHSLEPFGPDGRVATEIVVDGTGKIYAFGGGPADATNLSKKLGIEMYTADAVLLNKGMTASAKSLIGKKLQDITLTGIDYKTGDARLSTRQKDLFKRLNTPLEKLSIKGDLVNKVAGIVARGAGRSTSGGGGPAKGSVSTDERPTAGWETTASKLLSGIALVSFIYDLSHTTTPTQAIRTTTGAAGGYMGMGLGMEAGVGGGPAGMAVGATLGSIFGPKIVEDPVGFAKDAWHATGNAVDYVMGYRLEEDLGGFAKDAWHATGNAVDYVMSGDLLNDLFAPAPLKF